MKTLRLPLAVTLVAGLALAGCGGEESPPPTPPAPIPGGSAPVACIGKWSSGESGRVTCTAAGPNKDRAKIDKDSFRLDRICVNDERITSFTAAGGGTGTIAAKAEGNAFCATFDGVTQLPESCTCVAPSGGDCTPPADGFVCIATGRAPLGGG